MSDPESSFMTGYLAGCKNFAAQTGFRCRQGSYVFKRCNNLLSSCSGSVPGSCSESVLFEIISANRVLAISTAGLPGWAAANAGVSGPSCRKEEVSHVHFLRAGIFAKFAGKHDSEYSSPRQTQDTTENDLSLQNFRRETTANL